LINSQIRRKFTALHLGMENSGRQTFTNASLRSRGSVAKKFETGTDSDSLLRFSNLQKQDLIEEARSLIEEGSEIDINDLGLKKSDII
jgi:hypothetical protein